MCGREQLRLSRWTSAGITVGRGNGRRGLLTESYTKGPTEVGAFCFDCARGSQLEGPLFHYCLPLEASDGLPWKYQLLLAF